MLVREQLEDKGLVLLNFLSLSPIMSGPSALHTDSSENW